MSHFSLKLRTLLLQLQNEVRVGLILTKRWTVDRLFNFIFQPSGSAKSEKIGTAADSQVVFEHFRKCYFLHKYVAFNCPCYVHLRHLQYSGSPKVDYIKSQLLTTINFYNNLI